MIPRRALLFPLTLAMTTASCGPAPNAPATASVPVNAVAAMGDVAIDAATVAYIAGREHVTAEAALGRAIDDSLAAAEQKRRCGSSCVRQARRGALARTMLEGFLAEAREKGAPTDDEVARATQKRWWELDRPKLVRTTHVAVLVKKPEDDARARAVIARIADRVAGISDPAKFKAAASAVPSDGLEVRAEDAPPITSDGTIVELTPEPRPPDHALLADYAKAAFAIPAVGAASPVVHTDYGYHVILAVEFIPEHRVPLSERRALLTDEIVNGRASALYEAALAHARSLDSVVYERSAVDAMMQVQTTP